MAPKTTAVLVCVLACLAAALALSPDEICASAKVPCMKVPHCDAGFATGDYFLNSNLAPTYPSNNATAFVCHDEVSLTVMIDAHGPHAASTSQSCMDNVWEQGSVLESFVAPVASHNDNPMWYAEMDITSNGVLWASMIKNKAAGLTNNCPSCEAGHFACVGKADYAIEGFEGSATSTQPNVWTSHLHMPLVGVFPPLAKPPTVFRANFYRYDFPHGMDGDYELSAWSPTGTKSFHEPTRFGILVLA